MQRIYLYPPLRSSGDMDRVLSRLGWYFRPYLDRIASIHVTTEQALVDGAALAPHLDPAVADCLPAVRGKVVPETPKSFDKAMAGIDPARDILLVWDEHAEKGGSPALKAAIKALTPARGFYRVDPDRTRMEGSYYLWAGLNRFADVAALTARGHARMRAMAAEIGQHDKAYVFGTGPSLSDYVAGHDFSDGLTIVANSIVKNPDVIAKTKPKIIAACDPLYHAGCSEYAGAFRAELIAALEQTGAWFVCPMRDLGIYDGFLPAHLLDRVIGVPFDAKAGPPVDMTETFHWAPYPNVLTLALLPLAATLAREIAIAGCDGRALTDDSFFWAHDKKVQFEDKMAVIRAAHPAFFAIDYNDYYVGHCRDLEVVAETLEAAGRRLVNVTPSVIPALATRSAADLALPARPATRMLAMIDPDARDAWGHFLAYDKRLAEGAAAQDLRFALIARAELDPAHTPDGVELMLPCLTPHSWHLGKDWPKTRKGVLLTFAKELEGALDALEAACPEGGICVTMYVGSVEGAEVLEHLLVTRPRVSAVINLFWSYNFDETDPAYRTAWEATVRRLMRSPQIRLTHSTAEIAADYRARWGLDIPVLPHPSTTFGDAEAGRRARALPAAPRDRRPLRILFPGGARAEKGFLLSVAACAALRPDPDLHCVLRARLDAVSGPELQAAFDGLDTDGLQVVDGDLSDQAFVNLIAGADVVVLPYSAAAFARRTSGILVDATLLGRPVVVLEGTWLASIVAAEGLGAVAPATPEGVVAAIRKVAAERARHAAAIATAARAYMAGNSWQALVGRLRALADAAGPAAAIALPAPAQTEPAQTETAQTETAQTETAQTEAVQTEAVQTEGAQTEAKPQAPSAPPASKPAAPPAPEPASGDRALRTRLRALVATVPTKSPIYLPTEKIPLAEQVAGLERVKRIYDTELDTLYRPRMRALREAWKGHDRCFVIGNGPSLNRTDLSLLKDEVTFAVNGFFLKAEDLDWQPTFYCVEDHLVAEDRVKWINQLKGPTKLFPAYLRYVFPQGDDTIFFNHRPRKSYPHGFDFSTDAADVTYTGCTVTFTVMQLAFYLGFKSIHLIGVDADYDIPADARQASDYAVGVIDMQSDDPNHFHPDYFGKGFRWHDPQVSKMVEAYTEARRVVDASGQRIYNSTVGGKLEVFERKPFDALFPAPRPAPESWPRLLVLDMTAAGSGSATGELKSTLLADWPEDRVLQVGDIQNRALTLVRPEAGVWSVAETDREAVLAAIDAFRPEVIMYRPVPEVPHLHDLAMDLIEGRGLPLATWIMDDWPARLTAQEAGPDGRVAARVTGKNARLAADLPALVARSDLRLSICDAMSEAFEARYGVPFRAMANGVEAAHWPRARIHRRGPVLVRYAGGLAPDMTRDSVLRVARAVEVLAREGVDIRFEIHTRKVWFSQSRDLFAPFTRTRIVTETLPFDAYAAWLAEADVTVIAYNFDAATLRYVRYSMANKMPECLASGAALLAIGPRDIATIDYLARTGAAEIVDTPESVSNETSTPEGVAKGAHTPEGVATGPNTPERVANGSHTPKTVAPKTDTPTDAVTQTLRRLATDPAHRNALTQKARTTAFTAHNLQSLRKTLKTWLQTAKTGPEADTPPLVQAAAQSSGGRAVLLADLAARIAAPGGADRYERFFASTLASALLLDPAETLAQVDDDPAFALALEAVLSGGRTGPLGGHLAEMLEAARRELADAAA